jgi:hypothetical protein
LTLHRLLLCGFESLCLVAALASLSSAQTHPLIGITGDGASIPESLFLLGQTNASAMFVMTLGNGAAGETIAYNFDDDLLYHASGGTIGDQFWESVDVLGKTIVSSGQFTGPDVVNSENTAMVYDPATGRFLVSDLFQDFFDTTPAGAATLIGGVPDVLKGLAFSGGSLYGAANPTNTLYKLNPADGTLISSVAVTLGGNPVTGMNGLATHPVTGALWGIFRVGSSPGVRHLGTVDPTTGVVTPVGILQQNYAGIAFLPEPSPILALGAGTLAVALCEEHRRRSRRTAT